jgi:hypothetical protein
MESTEAARTGNAMDSRTILFPLLLIAALAVIAFSAMGMVTMLGWMPESLSSAQPVSRAAAAEVVPKAVREAVAPCADCGPAEAVGQDPAKSASPRG